jgi:formamidopyrimidine-DNA glycosylase
MPELPEVEVVKRGLEKIISDQPRIRRFEFKRKDLRDPIPIKKLKALEGAKILSVSRRAKYLLFETEKGGFLSHLGMTGSWRVAPLGSEQKHDHVYIELEDGRRLAYHDPRRFGIFETFAGDSPRLANLGLEPFDQDFSVRYLQESFQNKVQPVKCALMDQRIVVGVGNIYASEALHLCGVRPTRQARRLTVAEVEKLVTSVRRVLSQAISKGGSSISDFRGVSGDQGDYQAEHNVYGRQGEPCAICNTEIRMQVLAGRSTFWCPRCQR